MSFKSSQPAAEPTVANVAAADVSTNQQAVPVPWWIGPDYRALTWIVPEVYNLRQVPVRTKVGKKTQTTGFKNYGDVAGIAGLGLVRAIREIEVDGTVVWKGNLTRPTDPASPYYWRQTIETSVGTFYVYWGRLDQPVDDILLSQIGDHPAYRGQVVVIIKDYYLGDTSGQVPNTRLMLDRAPSPAIGNFPARASDQGESMVAGQLELATNPIFGAGLPAKHFIVEEWQALSAAVVDRVGCHAPTLSRAQPLRDVFRDFQTYYDGWCAIKNGQLRPSFMPHDGVIPDGLTELTAHDYTDEPTTRATSPSATINDVVVTYRDLTDSLTEKTASESASDNVEARRNHEGSNMSMPAIIDPDQAAAYAAEAADTGSEGKWEGSLRVRPSRARWASGTRLDPGDTCIVNLTGPAVRQISRITQRTDYYDQPPALEIEAERGIAPLAYVRPSDTKPPLGSIIPLPIDKVRVWELTPALAGSPIGLPVSFLVKRPSSIYENTSLKAANVMGFQALFSVDGVSYDVLGSATQWAVRGTLRTALNGSSADAVVQLALDDDNLDLSRLAPQNSDSQDNDNLLLVIGDEVFSIGAIALDALNYDFSCLRGRQGSQAAAHAAGTEAWIVWRDSIRIFTHKRFVEDQTRYFKFQPYTQSKSLELAEADPVSYHFRDRAAEKPLITLTALGAGMVVGGAYAVTGQIADVNGDMTRYQVVAAVVVDNAVTSEITLLSGEFAPDDRALYAIKTTVTFPMAGTWRIIARAWDETEAYTEVSTADVNVAEAPGGSDDGITPDAVADVVVAPGIEMLTMKWTNPTNTTPAFILIYESATVARPSMASFVVTAPQAFYFRSGLPEGTTKNYWFQVQATSGRKSAIVGPYTGTSAGTSIPQSVTDTFASISSTLAKSLAQAADHAGAIIQEELDRKTDVDSLARTLAAVIASFGDAVATVATLAEAYVGADGKAVAKWGTQLQAGSDGNMVQTGFEMIAQNGAQPISAIRMLANLLQLRSTLNGQDVFPFTVENGVVKMNTALIGAATITDAMIASLTGNKIQTNSLSSICAVIGLLRTASSGARLEIESNQIRVYDANGTLRVRMGVL